MTEINVVAYTRAIAGELDHSAQLDRIIAFCFARDWTLVRRYNDSEVSTSGSEVMFDFIESVEGEINTVVFYSRATAPTLRDGAPLYDVMYCNPDLDYGLSVGINFAAVTGELDTTTDDGRLAMNLSRHIFTMADDLIADIPGRELDKSTPEGQIIEELMGLRVVWLASKNEQWDELEEWMEEEKAKEGKKIIRIDRTDKTPDTD